MNKTGIYIHIPFCVKKCNYCAFLSYNADESPRKEYSEALIREIELTGQRTGGRRIDTVYIGGGTPSVMDVSQFSLIMKAVRRSFDISPDAEITLEANPGTLGRTDRVTRTKLQAYISMGVNRLSMGVQSMNNDRLHYLGRIHTAGDVARDFRYARQAGFDNISLDLIFSVPGETGEDALDDARRIIDMGPEHISCYSLQLEEGTPFYEMAERGELAEVSDEDDRETYRRLCRLLRSSGYEHYEISNFARCGAGDAPGFGCSPGAGASHLRSVHNSRYWDMSDYIGLGLGASGFEDGVRYRNVADLREYIDLLGSGNADGDPLTGIRQDIHSNSPFDSMSEAVFTGLRRREGIRYSDVLRAGGAAKTADCGEFWHIFREAREEAEMFAEEGFLMIDEEGMRLTEKGIDISNRIMSLFV